ncbi:mycothiol synthase [Glaciibacter sp. 2TAF33]|uniref:mycothiol synthase n=1 Tax=Glaciibacter sp. 2TAF33 TaxID=3233015 RepID=UPI003F91E9F3
MSLSVPDLTDAAAAASFTRIADAAAAVDGYRPFNEQSLLDLASGARRPVLIRADATGSRSGDESGTAGHAAASLAGTVVGAAVVGNDELDLVIAPRFRGQGHATRALPGLLAGLHGPLTAWSHGDHPAARVLAVQFRFVAARTLLQLRLSPIPRADAGTRGSRSGVGEVTIGPFKPGRDDADWIALNALVFADHPEQGRLTLEDLAARQGEPWFNSDDFLIARDDSGRMIGYNWLKVEPGTRAEAGEIYVIGIHPDVTGRGLGRTLMNAGLRRLQECGIDAADLYVDADNRPAVQLYRALGFTDVTVDVQYRRLPA